MSTPTVFIQDDEKAGDWSPFSETRPVGELRFGAMTLRSRALRLLGGTDGGHVGCHGLEGFSEAGSGVVTSLPTHAPAGGCWIWLSRAAAAMDAVAPEPPRGPLTIQIGGVDVGRFYAPGAPLPEDDALAVFDGGDAGVARKSLDGCVLEGPWDLVELNAEVLAADLRSLHSDSFGSPNEPGIYLTGDPLVSLGAEVSIGPGVVLDTRKGPIRLDDGCIVEGPARLVGPLHLGAHCIVFGGHLGALSAGPHCKLRGEIDSTVICGFSNKAHDGYLGHALLGHWVNLGAMTTNSDLKNNYSEVRVTSGSGDHATGRIKVGVFMGDHVKTGIGTMLNTGTVIGAGSNVFGGAMPPKWIPPFSWCGPDGIVPFRFDRFDEVARIVTARRNQEWPEEMSELFRRLFTDLYGSAD